MYPQTLKAFPSVDWLRNLVSFSTLSISFETPTLKERAKTVQMGSGFQAEYVSLKGDVFAYIDVLKALIEKDGKVPTITMASYSQGSAIACAATIDLVGRYPDIHKLIRLFALPRPGLDDFNDLLTQVIESNREFCDFLIIDDELDKVTGLPFEWMGFHDIKKYTKRIGSGNFDPWKSLWFGGHYPQNYDEETKGLDINGNKVSTKYIYGLKRDKIDKRDFKFTDSHIFRLSGAIPDKMDLTEHYPEIWNQGHLNSCTGHGGAAALGFNQDVQGVKKFTPSRLFIYYNARLMSGTQNSDEGASIRDMLKGIAKYGFVDEKVWPYDESKVNVKPPKEIYDMAKKNKLKAYYRVNNDIDEIRRAISTGHPVVFGIQIYDSFESDTVVTTGLVPMPKGTESHLGGHCITGANYDKVKGLNKERNSWGPEFGDKGYFYLPDEYLEKYASDIWSVELIQEN
jgi:hypothetical protein